MGQVFELVKQGFLRRRADAGFGKEGGGIGVGFVFIGARKAGGQKGHRHVDNPWPDAGEKAANHHRERGADGILAGKVDHAAARMAKGDMAQLMRDHRGDFRPRHFARAVAVVKATGQEDAPVGRGEAVHRLDLVDMDTDAGQVERLCHVADQGHEGRVGQLGRAGVQLARGAPDREPVEQDAIDQGEQDRGQTEHRGDMGQAGNEGKKKRQNQRRYCVGSASVRLSSAAFEGGLIQHACGLDTLP